MWTAQLVLAHFLRLAQNVLVTRRELLNYGTQAAVDSALRRMIRAQLIVRMAWGVYVRPSLDAPLPTADAVAKAKIAAFDREKLPTATTIAHQHGLLREDDFLAYEVDASSSQFRVFDSSDLGNCIVRLKAVVARKIVLNESPAGRAIKAVWRLGVEGCTQQAIALATINLGREDRRLFRLSHRRMPGWMSDMVHNFGQGFAQRRGLLPA